MKVGVYVSVIYPSGMGGQRAFEMTLKMTRTAYESGFDGVFVAEHHLLGPDQMSLPPFPLLGRLASEMPGRFLGTAVHLATMSHPVQTAENAALLDIMTGGRFILGVGQGYRNVEFESFGVVKSQRGPQLREHVGAMKALFSEDVASFKGEFYDFDHVAMQPQAIQRGGPPVWVGSDNVRTISLIPQYADCWIAAGRQTRGFVRNATKAYRAGFDELGLEFPGVALVREVHVARSREAGLQEVGPLLTDQLRSYHRMGQPGENYNVNMDEAVRGRLVVGNAEQVAEEVRSYRDEFKVPFAWFQVYWPGMAETKILEVIRELGESVIPLVRS